LAAQGPRGPRTTTRTADTAFDYRATRSMVNFYEIFDKEKRAAGRKRLQAEMRCVPSDGRGLGGRGALDVAVRDIPRLFR